jgi:hypothetical protein
MDITLTDQEVEILRGLLGDYLPDLRREVARTEQHDLRHLFVERQELVERLLARLAVKSDIPTSPPRAPAR